MSTQEQVLPQTLAQEEVAVAGELEPMLGAAAGLSGTDLRQPYDACMMAPPNWGVADAEILASDSQMLAAAWACVQEEAFLVYRRRQADAQWEPAELCAALPRCDEGSRVALPPPLRALQCYPSQGQLRQ